MTRAVNGGFAAAPGATISQNQIAYRVLDAARMSGLSKSSLYEAMRDGRLPSVMCCGRRLFLHDALESFIRNGGRVE
jgi:hypothetical protein